MLLSAVAVSVFYPRFRVWPPSRKGSWQQRVSWFLFAVTMIGPPLLGILDFETLGQGHWSRFPVGGLMVVIGLGIVTWGIRTLSAQQSLGASGKIVTEGPYRYTRNPQYLGFILLYAGVILAAYSFMALITGALIILLFLILPFSEEPWLRQQYGESYVEYCKRVPRFIGFHSLKSKRKNKK